MRDPNQQFIFNDEEISLIKNTFAEDDTLLYTVRKVLLQFPLTEAEKALVKQAMKPEVVRVLRKRILPEIGDEFPLMQLPSLLTTLTDDMKLRSVEEMGSLFAAKKLEIDYIEQQFWVLADVDRADSEKIKLSDLAALEENGQNALLEGRRVGAPYKVRKSPYLTYVDLTAYLFLLGYIDPMLGFIKSIAGMKTETVEQAKKRMSRDSTK